MIVDTSNHRNIRMAHPDLQHMHFNAQIATPSTERMPQIIRFDIKGTPGRQDLPCSDTRIIPATFAAIHNSLYRILVRIPHSSPPRSGHDAATVNHWSNKTMDARKRITQIFYKRYFTVCVWRFSFFRYRRDIIVFVPKALDLQDATIPIDVKIDIKSQSLRITQTGI